MSHALSCAISESTETGAFYCKSGSFQIVHNVLVTSLPLHLKRIVRTSAIQIWNNTRSLIYQKFERNQWWRSKFQTLVKTEPTDRFGSSFDTKSHSHIPISMQSFSYLPPLWKNNVIFGVPIKLEFKPSFSGFSWMIVSQFLTDFQNSFFCWKLVSIDTSSKSGCAIAHTQFRQPCSPIHGFR